MENQNPGWGYYTDKKTIFSDLLTNPNPIIEQHIIIPTQYILAKSGTVSMAVWWSYLFPYKVHW